MRWAKRKRGTPRQIGKPFPVTEKKRLPKLLKQEWTKRGRRQLAAAGMRDRIYDIARSALDAETDDFASDPRGYIDSLGWDTGEYTTEEYRKAAQAMDFSEQDIHDLAEAIEDDIRAGKIKPLAKGERAIDWKGGISVAGEINIHESNIVADFLPNFIAEKFRELVSRHRRGGKLPLGVKPSGLPGKELQRELVMRYVKSGMDSNQLADILEKKFPGRFTRQGILGILRDLEAEGKLEIRGML